MTSKSDIAISVRDLSKTYTIAHNAPKHTTMGEALMHRLRNPRRRVEKETFSALKDVSFDIQKGDVVGIIGRNGAGKSTLLKVLSRITEPTTGQIDIYGRVGSLLEVGTGFHPELTGRENIFMNGAILGMTKREIARQFDAIVEFAGVEQFLDTPVKRYSSGMYVRLAFAVAAHLNPEILIVDEVLAVGDAEFQRKCLGKMQDVSQQEGRTILFVSHNMGAIRSLCNEATLLKDGSIVGTGRTENIINTYLTANASAAGVWTRTASVPSAPGIYFECISISNKNGTVTGNIDSNDSFQITVDVFATKRFSSAQIAFRVINQEALAVFTTANSDAHQSYQTIEKGKHTYTVRVPGKFLPPGMYTVLAATMTPGDQLFDLVEDQIAFIVEDVGNHATALRDGRQGIVAPLLEWQEKRLEAYGIPALR